MRQRKIKNLETKYENYEDLIVYNPDETDWNEISVGNPIFIEIGCGKGKFISEIAEKHPDNFFVAIEGNKSVMLRAMEKVREKNLNNVRFIPQFVDKLESWFDRKSISGIYLNFSDPLPKNYTYKKRLTYRERLNDYFFVLKKDGQLTFKTDNTDLFNWTIKEILAANLQIKEITRDLHADETEDNIRTEYEKKFSDIGEHIKRVVVERKINQSENKIGEEKMEDIMMAAYNGREIPKEDKVFGASRRAQEAIEKFGDEEVINATIGALLDDEAKLIVMPSVEKVVNSLSGRDFAEYAPIAGISGFKEAIKNAVFGTYNVKSYTSVVSTPGGTGSIRNAIANYSCIGDKVLTHNWHWAPYKNITSEMGRGLEHFTMFDEEGRFNFDDFRYKVNKLLKNQERLVIIINTPANNPTGYSLSIEDWRGVKQVLDEVDLEKKVALVVDVAYIDFAGEEKETREFLPIIDNLRANILPIIAYSASKTFTFYGFRCAAMICMAHSPEIAEEFNRVCSYSSRASWSNSPRAPQVVIEKIYNDENLQREVDAERKTYRDMLLSRGKAFEKEASKVGLSIVPFRAGFFVTVPCEDSDALCEALEKKKVFLVPISGGARVSIASISEKKCCKLPKIIKETLDEIK